MMSSTNENIDSSTVIVHQEIQRSYAYDGFALNDGVTLLLNYLPETCFLIYSGIS